MSSRADFSFAIFAKDRLRRWYFVAGSMFFQKKKHLKWRKFKGVYRIWSGVSGPRTESSKSAVPGSICGCINEALDARYLAGFNSASTISRARERVQGRSLKYNDTAWI